MNEFLSKALAVGRAEMADEKKEAIARLEREKAENAERLKVLLEDFPSWLHEYASLPKFSAHVVFAIPNCIPFEAWKTRWDGYGVKIGNTGVKFISLEKAIAIANEMAGGAA